MKRFKILKAGTVLLAGGLMTSTASAFEQIASDIEKDSGGFVGLGVGVAPDYEGGDDYEATPAPFGAYHWASGRYVDLGGTNGTEIAARLKANVISNGQSELLEFGPLLQYRLERDGVDNNQVDAMKKVDDAVEAGAFIGLNIDRWSAAVSFAGDISDEHDGYLVYVDGGYGLPVNNKLSLDFSVHVTWASSNYMEDYFGVDSKNVGNSNLAFSDADSDFKDVGLGVTASYSFNKKWGLVGNAAYTRMLGDAEDSPLVDDEGDENQFAGVLAVTYSF